MIARCRQDKSQFPTIWLMGKHMALTSVYHAMKRSAMLFLPFVIASMIVVFPMQFLMTSAAFACPFKFEMLQTEAH